MRNQKTNLFLFVLASIILFAACKKSNSSTETNPNPVTDSVGRVSATEFNAVPPGTFEQVLKAFDDILRDRPSLKSDSLALGRAIFEWVKAHPNGKLNREMQEEDALSYTDLASRLTWEEWKLVITHPIYSVFAAGTVGTSGKSAITSYPCDKDMGFEDSKADALRHAYWNALMVRKTSKEFAELEGKAHESESVKASATAMDLHNNQVGRDLAVLYPKATDDQLLELLLQHKFYYLEKPNDPIPAEAKGALVYFAGKRAYDGTMNGTMTNPDSGGPWNAVFYFNQCDVTLRGEYTITRGSQLQKRRFTGTLKSGGIVVLNVSAPYAFENNSGLAFCENMVVDLNGSEKSLNGKWTSTNCGQGGTVTLVP